MAACLPPGRVHVCFFSLFSLALPVSNTHSALDAARFSGGTCSRKSGNSVIPRFVKNWSRKRGYLFKGDVNKYSPGELARIQPCHVIRPEPRPAGIVRAFPYRVKLNKN